MSFFWGLRGRVEGEEGEGSLRGRLRGREGGGEAGRRSGGGSAGGRGEGLLLVSGEEGEGLRRGEGVAERVARREGGREAERGWVGWGEGGRVAAFFWGGGGGVAEGGRGRWEGGYEGDSMRGGRKVGWEGREGFGRWRSFPLFRPAWTRSSAHPCMRKRTPSLAVGPCLHLDHPPINSPLTHP